MQNLTNNLLHCILHCITVKQKLKKLKWFMDSRRMYQIKGLTKCSIIHFIPQPSFESKAFTNNIKLMVTQQRHESSTRESFQHLEFAYGTTVGFVLVIKDVHQVPSAFWRFSQLLHCCRHNMAFFEVEEIAITISCGNMLQGNQ